MPCDFLPRGKHKTHVFSYQGQPVTQASPRLGALPYPVQAPRLFAGMIYGIRGLVGTLRNTAERPAGIGRAAVCSDGPRIRAPLGWASCGVRGPYAQLEGSKNGGGCSYELATMAPENKKANQRLASMLALLVRPERFERPTPWFVAKYSIQLSYGRTPKLLCFYCCRFFSTFGGLFCWCARSDSNARPLGS